MLSTAGVHGAVDKLGRLSPRAYRPWRTEHWSKNTQYS